MIRCNQGSQVSEQMKTPTSEQMKIVAQVTAQFWQVSLEEVIDLINTIEVVKFTGGKVAGILPAHSKSPPVFFKVYNNDAFRFEQAGLEAATRMPPVEGVSTPIVLAIMPEYKAVIIEKRTWEDSDSPWKRLWVNRLGINWYNVGAWLFAFYDTQVTNERNDYFLRRKYEKFESHVADLKHLFNSEQLHKIDQVYQFAREYYENETTEWVLSHGDFGLANIKITGNKLEIIDFEDCQLTPRAFDFLNCFIRMEYSDALPRGRTQYQQSKNDFLNGYSTELLFSAGDVFLELLIRLDLLRSYYYREANRALSRQQRVIFYFFRKESLRRIKEFLSVNYSIK